MALSTKTSATAALAVADRKIGDDSSAADRGKNPFSYLQKINKVKLLPKREKILSRDFECREQLN